MRGSTQKSFLFTECRHCRGYPEYCVSAVVLGSFLTPHHPLCFASHSLPLGSRPGIGSGRRGGGAATISVLTGSFWPHGTRVACWLGTPGKNAPLSPGPQGVLIHSFDTHLMSAYILASPVVTKTGLAPALRELAVLLQPGRGQHTLNFVT